MINNDKWINSLPNSNKHLEKNTNEVNFDKWTNSVPKKNNTTSFKKYTFVTVILISGLLFVSALKNQTRNLQKEINKLETNIRKIQFDLKQANLDHNVITSPENISLLAKEYLNINFETYKKSQIKMFNYKPEDLSVSQVGKKQKIIEQKSKKFSKNVRKHLAKKVEQKKREIKKLQELYSNPEQIPNEMKTEVAKKIKQKKIELKSIYNKPGEILTLERVRNWGVVQVVKVFLGIPVVPGR